MIIQVNGEPITQVNDLVTISQSLTKDKTVSVPVLVQFERNLANYLTVIKIGPEAEEKRPLEAWKPWLGVSTQVLTNELADALGLNKPLGVFGYPKYFRILQRERAGLKEGDLIFRMDGQVVQAHRPEDVEVFGNMIKQYRIDSNVTFEIWRTGKLLELQATLTKRPTPANELPEFEDEDLEYTVRELSFADRVFLRITPDEKGVLVENVESAGWASLAGLRQGDILLKVNKEAVLNIEAMKRLRKNSPQNNPTKSPFCQKRNTYLIFGT